jgi:predicted dehydrogenase
MAFSEIRAAVVGVGFIGVAHVEALRRLGIEVVGVLGSTPERARRKAVAANLPHVYESLEELLADDNIDVVHIASPNHLHQPQARAALEAGKHVVCEKPLALNAQQTDDLVSLGEASGLVHAVCFNLRFYPLCHQMRALVQSGAVGEPRLVTGSYMQDWLLLPSDWNWRLVPEQAGFLRAVADIGSHWLDLARFVTGKQVVDVMADLHTLVPIRRRPPGPVETFASTSEDGDALVEEAMTSDDAAGILLRFEDGARGVLAVSQVSAGKKNSLAIEIDGSRAALAWGSEDPERLWIGHRERPNEILMRDPGLVSPEVAPLIAYPGGHVEGYPDTFRALFAAIYADVDRGTRSETPAYPTFADGHDAVCVTEAIAASSAVGTWVNVER